MTEIPNIECMLKCCPEHTLTLNLATGVPFRPKQWQRSVNPFQLAPPPVDIHAKDKCIAEPIMNEPMTHLPVFALFYPVP